MKLFTISNIYKVLKTTTNVDIFSRLTFCLFSFRNVLQNFLLMLTVTIRKCLQAMFALFVYFIDYFCVYFVRCLCMHVCLFVYLCYQK